MKDKTSLIKYISLEKNIFTKISQSHQQESDLAKQSILRILRAFSIGLSWFKDDINIWLSYIKFCTQIGDIDKVTNTFPLMLQIHKKANLWLLASQWEITQFNNVDKALGYLYRGVHHNPTVKELYMKILELELSVPAEENETRKQIETKTLNLLDVAKKNIKELLLYEAFLKTSEPYKFLNRLQLQICLHIIKNFTKSEDAWNLLSQRELSGYHIMNFTVDTVDKGNDNNFVYVEKRKDQINNCLNVFKIALNLLPTEKMWEKYLNTLVDLHERFDDQIYIQDTFQCVCQTAHEKGYMTELHYIVWLNCLKDSPIFPTILKQVTEKKPQYIKIWGERILCHVLQETEDNVVETVFNEAFIALGDNSFDIWQRKLQYYQLKSDNCNTIEKVYQDALDFSPKISLLLQAQYLEWAALFRNRDIVYDLYKKLSLREPFCLELHKKMVELEAISREPKDEIFECVKNNINNNPDFLDKWQEYIFKEVNYGKFIGEGKLFPLF